MRMKKAVVLLMALGVLVSCQKNPLKINISKIEIDFQFKSLDDELFAAKGDLSEKLPEIEDSFGEFYKIFTQQMIRIGSTDNPETLEKLQSFLNDSVIIKVKRQTDELIDEDQIQKDFEQAFKHYHYYFPEKKIPDVYTCISGFNQSIVVSEDLIGISLDKYLGDSEYYPQLGIAKYKVKNMHPEKIVPDAMYAWALTDYPIKSEADKLIEHMIYKGKLMYFLDAMMPDVNDSIKIGYSAKQVEFCKNSEQGMWTYLAEHKMLFSTKRMDIKRYVDDGPYTSNFTTDSPGRVGVWLGWQIVKAYMEKNPEVTLKELLENEDYLKILNQSGYSPD